VGRDMNSDCKLLRGDCLDLLKTTGPGSVDMVLADLPYGTTACKWDRVIPFEPLWAELHRVCKPNAAMCMFGSEPFSSALRMSALEFYRYDWIWEKNRPDGFLNAKRQPLRRFETVSVFSVKTPRYFPQLIKIPPRKMKANNSGSKSDCFGAIADDGPKYAVRDFMYPQNILKFDKVLKDRKHPTQKPIELLEYLIKTYTNEGDTVLDPTMGCGSTGVACKNLGRKFIGIELDANYFNIAKRRIEACSLQAELK
jgi:DNA modification methylase